MKTELTLKDIEKIHAEGNGLQPKDMTETQIQKIFPFLVEVAELIEDAVGEEI